MRTVFFASVLVLAGCSSPATQIVVAVDTDYDTPAELSFVKAKIVSDDGRMQEASWTIVASNPDPNVARVEMPFSFGVAPEFTVNSGQPDMRED